MCDACASVGPKATLAGLGPEIYDRIARAYADDREPAITEYVRNGVFQPIGGLADPSMHSPNQIRRAGVQTVGEYLDICYRAEIPSLEAPQLTVQERRVALGAHYPAYCDYLPLDKTYDPRHPARIKDADCTPLVWVTPFRGRPGITCGYRHVKTGSNAGAYLNEVCPHMDYIKTAVYHCWRPACPRCAWDWACRKASEVEERMQSWEAAQEMTAGMQWLHVVFSPPQEYARGMIQTKEGLNRLYGQVMKMAHDVGLDTGMVAIHPWRQNKSTTLEGGIVDMSMSWRVGVHFHVLAWGRVTRDKEQFRKDGWYVGVKSTRDNSDRDLGATLSYVFSHVGLASPVRPEGQGRQLKAYRLFGGLSNGQLRKVDELKFERQKTCPECGEGLLYLQDSADPVVCIDRVRVYAFRADYHAAKEAVKRLRADMETAGVPEADYDLQKYLVYLNSKTFWMADKLRICPQSGLDPPCRTCRIGLGLSVNHKWAD
ncbi:MAG: hypothetical protein RBR71_13385 [Gudongella sp.]|nr:hypothetical protein [Gudongella sp.]